MLKDFKEVVKITKILLLAIGKLLATDQYFPKSCGMSPLYIFESEGGIDLLEDFQKSPNVDIFSTSQTILKKFYPGGEEVNNDMDTEIRF